MSHNAEVQEQKAASYAREQVTRFLSLPADTWGPTGVFLWYRCQMTPRKGKDGRLCIDMDPASETLLLNTSLKVPSARRVLQFYLSTNTAAGQPLSRDMALAASLFIKGEFPAPAAKPGPKEDPSWDRQSFVIALVRDLVVRFRLNATEGPPPKPGKKRQTSAAGIVSKEFKAQGVHEVTVRAVRELWSDSRKRSKLSVIEAAIDEAAAAPRTTNWLRRYLTEDGR